MADSIPSRTRKKSGSNLSEYLGPGKDLLVSELPTLREFLRYGLFLQETNNENKRNCPTKYLMNDVYSKLIEKWSFRSVFF